MKDNTNNKDFWNDYVYYWENKVAEANKGGSALDKTVDDILLEDFFDRLKVEPEEKLLDYGCGFGRLYPIYHQKLQAQNYYGIDVSEVSLQHAKEKYFELQIGKNLIEFDGENIPFSNNHFDKIICFSVFDAVNQEKVLSELLRVLKRGGILLMTGKNIKYFGDDEEAFIAEVNARKKGHPNSFTDVAYMEKQLSEYGIKTCEAYYFLKRRDFALNRYVNVIPDVFYQWALMLKKDTDATSFSFQSFSSHYSKTYQEAQQNGKKGR